jgi:hypothetical protein
MTDQEMIVAAAEKVLGWRIAQGHSELWESPDSVTYPVLRVTSEDCLLCETRTTVRRFDPLEFDADAFMLVDAMAAKGYDFRMHQIPNGAALASFVEASPRCESGGAYADACDRRRAILLAALKAIAVEVPV